MLHPVLTELASGLPKETQEYLIDTAELAADSIVYLTSERREWLGGRYVSVNWDMEKLIQQKDRIVKEDLLKVKLSI